MSLLRITPLVLQPLSWLPAANALTTLCVVKPYRRYVLSLCGRRKTPVGDTTATSIAHSRAPAAHNDGDAELNIA